MGKSSRTKKERWKEKIGEVASRNIKSPREIFNFFKFNIPILLLVAFLALIAYANGLTGQFLSADDIPGIVQNPILRDFWQASGSFNLISTYDSAMIHIFGVKPVPFHVVSLVLHIINTYLVMLLAYQLFGKRPALYASLIFCLLPSGSEAIFWIAGMGYMFQALFSLICLNLFFLFRTTGDKRFFISSALTYLLALIFLQTPWMFTVPLIIVALDVFCLHRINIRQLVNRWWQYGSFLLVTGIYWLIFMSGKFSARVTALITDYYFDPGKSTGLLFRLPYTVYKAVELYLVPLRLSFFHEEALTKPVYYFMVAVTVLTLGLLVYLLYKKSKYGGLMLAIFASTAPTFSPVQVAWFIAERYLYLGGAFFAMIFSLLLIKLDYKTNVKNLAGILVSLILVCYSVRLITRANDFKSSKTLWTATQKTAPTSYRVYNNLGDVYSNEQNWEKAISALKTSIALAPDYADAIHNLGYTYMLMGDYENAKKYLLESYQKNPRLYQALEKLGQIELAQGNTAQAQEYFAKVKELNPQIEGLPNF
jgi:tetratricopeptide (TPR) repeat protein